MGAGPWWFREADYRLILIRYKSGGLGTVARSAGAVLLSWSLMNISIKGRLLVDLNAYTGKSRTHYRDLLPNGMYITLRGWPEIDQLYIPNLRGPAFGAVQVVRQNRVTTDGFVF